MLKRLKFYIIAILVFFMAVFSVKAGRALHIEGIENLGMGGVGTAFNSPYGPLYNPAVLGVREGFNMTAFDRPVSVSKDIFKFISFYRDNSDELKNFRDLKKSRQAELMEEITDKVSKYRIRVKLGDVNPKFTVGPFPILGPTGDLSWGLGFANQADAGAKMNPGIYVPTIDFWGRVDGVLYAPFVYSTYYIPFRLPGKIHAGINLKTIMRSRYERKRMSIMEFSDFNIDSEDLKPGYGFGWDWGALYEYSDRWDFSFVIKDFLSSRIAYPDDSSEVIKSEVDFGAAYKLTDSVILAADVRNFKSEDTYKSTFFTKLYFGGEYSLGRLLKLRGGFYQGYPSFGVGLLNFLNYSFYGRELSCYPGLNSEWNHALSLSGSVSF